MYLSQLILNRINRDVLRDIASPEQMHKSLWRAFPENTTGGPGRVLFRVEPIDDRPGDKPAVLVQSEKRPEWSELPRAYFTRHRVTSLEFATEPTGDADCILLQRGDCFRFRLVANPTKKLDGRRHGLYREKDQRSWLSRKGSAGGFEVAPHSLLAVPMGTLRSHRKDRDTRSWFAVRFEGRLRVTDARAFVSTLTNGIGPAKGFGFGLLSIARR